MTRAMQLAADYQILDTLTRPLSLPSAFLCHNSEPVALECREYWDGDAEAAACEREMARQVLEAGSTQWAFATRAVVKDIDEGIAMRRANLRQYPLQDGEEEVVWVFGVDLGKGIDIAKQTVYRVGSFVRFSEPESLTWPSQLLEGAPGFELMQAVLRGGVRR